MLNNPAARAFHRLGGVCAVMGGGLFALVFPAWIIDVNEDETSTTVLFLAFSLAWILVIVGLVAHWIEYRSRVGLMGRRGFALTLFGLALMPFAIMLIFFWTLILGVGTILLGLSMLKAGITPRTGASLLALGLPGSVLAWWLGSAFGTGTFQGGDDFSWAVIAFGAFFGIGLAFLGLGLERARRRPRF